MKELTKFYINGEWVEPVDARQIEVINPATEQPVAKISMAGREDVERAVAAAKNAFETFSQTSREERLELLNKLAAAYKERYADIAEAITLEMGAPAGLSQKAQAATGLGHITTAIEVLKNYEFEEDLGTTRVFKEPIGVCGLITPWNWPMNQVMCKVAPALATGCTIILKPSQVAPLDAYILAELIDAAGYPAGVFNLINGAGPQVGEWLATHPDVDMISLTGSTYAGAQISKHAADTIKRVSLELGGKSANIILDDADLEQAVKVGVLGCMNNTGQSCNAPTRMLVPADKHDEAVAIARQVVEEKVVVGPPDDPKTTMGPQANEKQWKSVQKLIQQAIDEGCELVCGGTGKPEGLEVGYYTKPTIFANVKNSDTIAQEEVFGPVLVIIPYQDEEDAIRIANDSIYGLSGYVSGSLERARRVASRMRTGMVHINGAPTDIRAPFGGYKQSGNGREWGAYGFDEFLEIKAVMGYEQK